MNKHDNGGRAFPWCGDLNECPTIQLGMTLRDYFAAAAMQGMMANNWNNNYESWANHAYMVADAMLEARK